MESDCLCKKTKVSNVSGFPLGFCDHIYTEITALPNYDQSSLMDRDPKAFQSW